MLLLSRADDPGFVAELRIFNPDGSEAQLSGNGARQAVLYLRRHGWTDEDTFTISTPAGPITPTITSPRTATIEMGRAATISDDYPDGRPEGRGTLRAGGREWGFQHVSIGNPQCVIEVGADVEGIDVAAIGAEVERHELFPNRTNVSFTRTDGNRVRARIFERGVGETLSSGTGASGAAVAAVLRGSPSPITVELDGGETHGGCAQHGRREIEMTGNDAGRRGEVIALLCFRKDVGHVVPLVAPGIHVNRRKENSKRAVHNDPETCQVMRETKPRRELEFVGIG